MNQDRLAQLANLLTNLRSPNNTARSQAENDLNAHWVDGPQGSQAELLVGLASLATLGDAAYRSFAAILLRRYAIKFTQDANGKLARTFDVLPEDAKAQIRQLLLQGFSAEQSRDARHKLADTMSEIARGAQWPELLPVLVDGVRSENDQMREATFRIFAAAPELLDVSQAGDAAQLLQLGFSDSSPLVQVAATETFSAFFDKLPKEAWSSFKPLLPALLRVMEPLRQSYQTLQLTSVLESLIDLAGIAPKMFSPVFVEVTTFALSVAGDTDMDETARMSALEFCVTFSQQAPNMCKKQPTYIEKMVQTALQMLVEIESGEDATAEWNNEDEYQLNEDYEQIHNAAKDALDRMALRLDSSAVIGPLFQYIPKMLGSQTDWRERHGALMALSSVAEGCRDVMINELSSILDMIIPLFDDAHSRVQWAACNALGQMSTDFADLLQRRFGARVLSALIAKLSDQSTYRVQVHAAAAIFNFSENATKEVLDPYLDDLLQGLLTLLSGPKRYVQEQALATISIVADAAQSKFIKYYDVLMPQLMNVLRADTGNEYQLLKAKSIECSTLIALAVGKEKFLPQFHDLVQIFSAIQEHATDDNPCQVYLVQAWARICKVIGPEFLPYLSRVMPPVLKVAKSDVDYQILDDDGAQAYAAKEGWEVQKMYGHYIGLHISGFEDKANCIERLGGYASELGADFYPYVPEIVKDIAIPSLSFFYFEEARINACQLIPHLISSAQLAATRKHNGNKQEGKSDPQVLEIWQACYSALLALLVGGDEAVYIYAEMLTTLFQCISLIGPASVPPEVVGPLMGCLLQSTKSLEQRIVVRQSQDENDEFIEEDEEEEAEEADENLVDATNRIFHVLFKTLRTDFLPFFDSFVPVLTSLLQSVPDCVELGLGIVNDLVEYTGPQSAKYISVFGDIMLQSATSDNSRIRQAAIYGIGVAAQHGGDAYKQACLHSIETLFAVVNQPHSRDQSELAATENASCSIAKILRHYGSSFGDQYEMALTEWIKTLPIIEDYEVAPFAYQFLSDLIDAKHPAVMAQIDKVFAAVASALVFGSIQGKCAHRVLTATKGLLASLPQDQAMQLFHTLPVDQQPIIQQLFA